MEETAGGGHRGERTVVKSKETPGVETAPGVVWKEMRQAGTSVLELRREASVTSKTKDLEFGTGADQDDDRKMEKKSEKEEKRAQPDKGRSSRRNAPRQKADWQKRECEESHSRQIPSLTRDPDPQRGVPFESMTRTLCDSLLNFNSTPSARQ